MLKIARINNVIPQNICILSWNRACKGQPLTHVHRSAVSLSTKSEIKSSYDAVIIGGGHNGLVSAAYLQKEGLSVCVLEKRHVIGGAAVTEEIFPGFKFSRASYLLSLLRPEIVKDLELKRHGLEIFLRNPNSYTPLRQPQGGARSLTLGACADSNRKQIAQFSQKDAEAFERYEATLQRMVDSLDPLLDHAPLDLGAWTERNWSRAWRNRKSLRTLARSGGQLGSLTAEFYELMTAPASKVLDKWFDSEPLKATLATDSVIGAMTSPQLPGSGYVLLHHVMGELEGVKGAWGYVKGGMGALSEAIASCARERGAAIYTDQTVSEIMVDSRGKATGVVLSDGREVKAKVVLSNATPKVTYLDLVKGNALPEDFLKDVKSIDYTSPVTKINVAVSRLPNFIADPNAGENEAGPHHQTTIHINCEHSQLIHDAYVDAVNGDFSSKPVIEMTIPSVLDPSVAPVGGHVVQLFTQYTPYTLSGDREWDQATKDQYADTVFDCIEEYAPGFKDSVLGRDILTPRDLDPYSVVPLLNIFHGAMSLDQLYITRPLASHTDTRCPISGLYLCGSGAHPGGGVMGSPGRLAAQAVMRDYR